MSLLSAHTATDGISSFHPSSCIALRISTTGRHGVFLARAQPTEAGGLGKEKRNLSNICTGGRTGKLETPRNTHLALRGVGRSGSQHADSHSRGENPTKSTSKKRQPESRNGKKDRGEYGIYYSCSQIWGCTRDEPTHIIGPVIKPVRIPRIWRRGRWYARSPKCGGTRTHYQTLTPDAPR